MITFKALRRLWQSLQARVTLFTLAIFVASLWLLAVYISRELRADMQRVLGEQQFSTASFVAAEVNSEMEDRLRSLEIIAQNISPALLSDTKALQAYLEARLYSRERFNGGLLVRRPDGITIAEVPIMAERIGVNYSDVDSVAAALKMGKSSIGRPVMGRKLHAPLFGMAVPIRDGQGNVISALSGVTNLGIPNFLDRISGSRYGKTGGHLLVAPQHRLIVTATDKSRIMEVLPPRGTSPWMDRVAQGYEGTGVFVNPVGVEVLTSVKRVPVAGWFVATALPTAEAFAPIRAMERRLLLATIGLTLLAGALTWWMVKRQLAPMLAAARSLAIMSATDQPPRPLPIAKQDEIGALVGGFNQLLEVSERREAALKESEERFRTIFEEAPLGMALIESSTGTICEVNPRFVEIVGGTRGEAATLDRTSLTHPDDVEEDLRQLSMMNAGKIPGLKMNKRYARSDGSLVWIDMTIAPLTAEDTRHPRHVAMIEDITERKRAQEAVQSSLVEKEALLKEVHHRVKNNLQVVTSLLRLEAGRSTHPATQSVLGDMQGRIRSMALLHESLYRSGTFAAVDLGAYLQQLATQAFRALVARPGAIQLHLDLASVHVEMDKAMPCGLLVNELVSNSLKHGFPDGRTGEVRVELRHVDGSSRVQLRVSDTGVGLPADFESRRRDSLGLQLVTDLARQLSGTLEIGPGTIAVFTVTFTAAERPAPASLA